MPILSRKPGERVVLGDNIELTIVDVSSSKVRLRVTAPAEATIHREEVARQVEKDEEDAPGWGIHMR